MKRLPRRLTSLPPAFATLLLLSSFARAAWPVQFGNSSKNYASGVATDTAGNVFAGGYTEGGILGQTSLGLIDGYVAKWDTAGTLQWASLVGTASSDGVLGLTRVGTSHIAAAGYTDGSLPTFTSAGSSDAMVRLYNGTGTTLWTRQFGTSGGDRLEAITADSLGHLYVAGTTQGSFAGYTNAGGNDAFVSQLDATTGAVNWTFQIGSIGFDIVHGLGADGLGNVYLGGETNSTLPGQTYAGGGDAFVLKLDVSGALQWVRQFGTSSGEEISAVAVDSTGSVLLGGYTDGTLPGQTSAGNNDAFVRKLDANGTTLWTHQFGTSGYERAYGLAVDAADQVVVGGQTDGTFPGETTPDARYDGFVRVLAADGTVLSTDQFGGTGSVLTEGGSLAVDASGHAYLAGHTDGALPGQTYQGKDDAFLIQFTLPVPEPTTATLLLGGLTLLGLRRRRG